LALVAVLAVALIAGLWNASPGRSAGTSSATDLTRLPLGDGKLTTTGPKRGYVYRCGPANPNGPGAFRDGPWIDAPNGRFNLTAKAVVDGRVTWPARVRFSKRNGRIKVTGNGLPVGYTTGVFPIAAADDAYQYDRNPNSISAQTVSYTLPRPRKASKPSCLRGAVGIALDGVAIFDGLDATGRDAVAHETQDSCMGHPERTGTYHYHAEPLCISRKGSAKRQSGQFGWALDGYPIFGPRGPAGRLLTNDDLDVCHGTTSTVTLSGKRVRIYHYVATYEFPYTVGCFHGTPLRTR
jgi:hypothetical protein